MTGRSTIANVIWDRRANPTRHVSDALGIERWQLSAALHRIKARNGLGGRDIYSDGKVTGEDG